MARAEESASRRVGRALSWALVAGMALQAATGLLVPNVYRDAPWIRAAWFGNDIVTLALAAPLLAGGLRAARRGSVRGELVWSAGLAYAVYNYAYYMFGARLGAMFPLFVVLFVTSVAALVTTLSSMDVPAIARRFGPGAPVRSVAIYAAVTGVGLAVAWLAQWAAYVFGGREPSIGAGPFQLVAAMDLSFIVPPMIVGAAVLWRRRPWGYVISATAIGQGAAYTAVLTAGSLVAGLRGIPGTMEQVPVWAIWTLAGSAAAAALVRSARLVETA